MKPNISLRQYLSLQFGVLAALPVFLIAILVWLFLIPQMRADIASQHRSLARSVAEHISAHMRGAELQLKAAASCAEALERVSEPQLAVLLDSLCGNGELFDAMYLVSNDTGAVDSVGLALESRAKRDDLLGLDMSGRDFVIAARGAGDIGWSEPFLDTVGGGLAVALTVSVSGHVVVGEIALDKLSDIIGRLPVPTGEKAVVLDRNGRVVADSSGLLKGGYVDLKSLPDSGRKEEGFSSFSSDLFDARGEKLVGTVAQIDRLGWKVLVAQPSQTAYQSVRSAFVMIGAGLAVALVLALILAGVRAQGLTRIFRLFTEQCRAIAGGNYDLRFPPPRTNEFKHLARSVEDMARTIKDRERRRLDSETNLRITLDSIGDAVVATDAKGAVARMNPVAENLTGWSSAEAVGRPLCEVFRIVNADTRQKVANPAEKVLEEGATIGLDNQTVLISKDCREYQIADSAAPIRHTNGNIVGVVLVFRDVTDSYAREKKIRENEKQLKDIASNIPGVIYKFISKRDHSYYNTFISEKAYDVFGLKAEPGKFFDEFFSCIPENEKGGFIASVRQAVDEFVPWSYEGRFVKPDGEQIWFSGHSAPHRDGDSVVFYGVLMDITRSKRMEESLRLTQFCFEKSPIAIFRIGDDAHILDANERACNSLGYSMEELCRMTVFDIDPEFDPEIWPEHIAKLKQARTRSIETLHRHKDGNVFPVQVLVSVMSFEKQDFHVAYVQDISERKRAEKEALRLESALRQAQKMEAIGTLAGGIAHDFNNILSGVIGFSELSLATMRKDAREYDNIQKILTAGLRAKDLVRQILTFSRKDESRRHPLQIAPLVKESIKLLRSSLPSTIEISQQIASGTDFVLADPTHIHQIVMNLCTNAAHAMEIDGGGLEIRVSQVRLSEQDTRLYPSLGPGEYIHLSVQDSGKGIPPEIIDRIFEPYFTTKEKEKGTGLGLSVVHGIVRSYGGAIFAYSEPPGGATFNVYIPTIKSEDRAGEEAAVELAEGDEHILVVDDEPVLIDVGRQLLENLGYRVSTANDGMAALELFREIGDDIDLVLTDMTMPRMTGEKLAAEFAKIRPDIPVILSTGYALDISSKTALKESVAAVVLKPLVEADLARIVRKVLDERKK